MNKIQRYILEPCIGEDYSPCVNLIEESDGYWVKWEDVEAFVKDAGRYRWLRDTHGVSWDNLIDGGVSMWVGESAAIRAQSLDVAIDKAMSKDNE